MKYPYFVCWIIWNRDKPEWITQVQNDLNKLGITKTTPFLNVWNLLI